MSTKPIDAEKRLTGFIAKFEPKHRVLIRAVRGALRARFPAVHELVYDNYNFFFIGYGPTQRPSDCIISLTAASNGVGLCFIHGASLPDPHKILLGFDKQARFLQLESAAVLKRREVEARLTAAEARLKTPFATKTAGKPVIRSVSVKQRARRTKANKRK